MNLSPIEYEINGNIKIYKGTTIETRRCYEKNIKHLKSLVPENEKLFTELQPSTLTAQGCMSNILFDESDIMHMLSVPTGAILLVGCNFGEKYNPEYKIPEAVQRSGRGRKPKVKPKNKRRSQGTGKYFSSQITFLIRHPTTSVEYKIKLFRNGVFQVPGVKDPSMSDLIEPIAILREYLAFNFDEDVQVLNFMAVMRNYKAKLIEDKWHVDLEELEKYINHEKSYARFTPYINFMISSLPPELQPRCMQFIGKTNPMNIAEITYNTDRCFCLILKFYRPMPADIKKKTTVKLLKKGKINFDGGNSEFEVKELYHWLEYIYYIYRKLILVDVATIRNEYDENAIQSILADDLIYSDGEDSEPYNSKQKITQKRKTNKSQSNISKSEANKPQSDISKLETIKVKKPLSKKEHDKLTELIMKSLQEINDTTDE